ncbi:hybrid sensor histidine kinase/response regulator [Gemmata sp.]|uniref:hybrid sensor histidine kinase/response regulator n=1 Tax=Gemmata sp. TaxID=1914242 RepID=UPI003F7251DB
MTGIDAGLFDLFREEVRTHTDTMSRGLLDVEGDPGNPTRIEPLMRGAHSIKGACRIVGIDLGVRLAHVMEDALVAAQNGQIRLTAADIDTLLRGSDVLRGLADLSPSTVSSWAVTNAAAVEALDPVFVAMAAGKPRPQAAPPVAQPSPNPPAPAAVVPPPPARNAFPQVPQFTRTAVPTAPLQMPANYSMTDMFREELRSNLLVLDATKPEEATECLQQIRGAARLIKCQPVDRVAAAVSAYFAAAGDRGVDPGASEWLAYAAATLAGAIGTDDDGFAAWVAEATPALTEIAEVFDRAAAPAAAASTSADLQPSTHVAEPAPAALAVQLAAPVAAPAAPGPTEAYSGHRPEAAPAEAVVRVTAQSLNRLMGLAGESLVQARWLPSFSASLLSLRKQHDLLAVMLDGAFHAAAAGTDTAELGRMIAEARRQAGVCRASLNDKAADFDDHAARGEDLNTRLYREVIVSRMRPFGDGVHGLPRMVRDMSRTLGKEAKLVVEGEKTEVDRDILEKLESPLSHLIRNAVDHGVEPTEARVAAGKPAAGTIRLEARHRAGMLQVTVSDDGGGVNLDKLRKKIVDRGLSAAEVVRQMQEPELLEFLFLPGFSTAAAVTEFSGRGVGLDVVQDTIRRVGGSVRVTSQPGRGTTFHLQLPLTLSVIRAVVVNAAGEPYAFPHNRIDRLLRVPRAAVKSLEHRQFVTVDGQNVGLVVATQLLDLPATPSPGEELAVVLLSDATGTYGLVVDSFRGEQDLVVRTLDPRLGKVPNLSAAAILDDGSPVLIVDVEDLLRSMDQYIQTGALSRCDTRPLGRTQKKRVLIVDDSITVREVERQLLVNKGYEVVVAVDGMDGWNKVRADQFDLMVSDIDMPRMSGLQLVTALRSDAKLRDLPVVIVSYKEREEDRARGLEVGANCYLTKSSFHDNRFIEAVEDLIGPAV